MKVTIIVVAFALAAACVPAGAGDAPVACGAVPGLDPLLRVRDVVLVGEMHGTVESPAFVGRAVCVALAGGRPVTVGLEIPIEEDARIRAYLASSGSASDRDALLAGAFWQAPFQDGRRSRAMLALLEDLRRTLRAGGPVHLLLLDSTAFRGGSERDRAMAGRLRDAIAGAPHDLFLVLTGNLHTRLRQGVSWDPSYEPMGLVLTRLAPKLPIAALDVAYTGGSAWICETPQPASCGAKTLKGRPDAGSPGVTLAPTVSAEGYSGVYGVGTLTASPPALLDFFSERMAAMDAASESYFLTIAQLALGFGALAGLLNAFRFQVIQGIKLILEHSVAAIGFSLLPVCLTFSSRLQGQGLRISSFLLALFLIVELIIQVFRLQRGYSHGTPPRRPVSYATFLVGEAFWGCSLMYITLSHTSLGWYALALTWLLVPGALQLFTFVSVLSATSTAQPPRARGAKQ
jgi:hypothetical protein